jgi:hypothetical protein
MGRVEFHPLPLRLLGTALPSDALAARRAEVKAPACEIAYGVLTSTPASFSALSSAGS